MGSRAQARPKARLVHLSARWSGRHVALLSLHFEGLTAPFDRTLRLTNTLIRVGHTRPCPKRRNLKRRFFGERCLNIFANGYTDELAVMNQSTAARWSPMVSAPDEEFAHFLEFGDLELDFPPFEALPQDGRAPEQGVDGDADVDATLDHPMENAPAIADFGMGHIPQHPEQAPSNPLMNGYNGDLGQLFNMQTHREQLRPGHHTQAHMKTQRHYRSVMVPPTPNSVEMHGGLPGYYHTSVHQQPHVYEHYQRSQRDQVGTMGERRLSHVKVDGISR